MCLNHLQKIKRASQAEVNNKIKRLLKDAIVNDHPYG